MQSDLGPDVHEGLRRNVITSAQGRTAGQSFPLPSYIMPAPELPWTDEPGLLTSALDRLVFYQHDIAPEIYVPADRDPEIMSVVICSEGTCP